MINYEVKIYVDSLCLIIFALVFLYVAFDKRNRSDLKLKRSFLYITIFSMTMIGGDLLNWSNSGQPGSLHRYLVWTGNIMFYASSGFLVNSLISYINCIISKRRNVNKFFLHLGTVIAVTSLIAPFSSIFIKQVFYVNEANCYVRGPLYILTQFPVLMYILVVAMLIVYRSLMRPADRVYICLYTFIPVLGEIIQLIIPTVTTLIPGMTIALLILFIYIQNEKSFQDSEAEKNEIDTKRKELEEERDLRERQLFQSMETIVNISEKRKLCTNGHAKRVGTYTREIAHRMGLDDQHQIEAYYAGLFHDIGMVDVAGDIINKPEALNYDEYEKLKSHTISGYHALTVLDTFSGISAAARWHHERIDGKGYPSGLIGNDIPLIAKIVAVADAYDSMTSNRPYRKKLTQKQVIEQFNENSGTQFDPEVVNIMLTMIEEDHGFEMQENNLNQEISILVVDDDPVMLDTVETALSDESYSITFACDGTEAIELMKVEDFSLCILDIEMPNVNGFQVLEWINANRRNMKTIFMTETKDMKTIEKCEQLGAKDYITKPVSFVILKKCINSIIS